MGSKEFSKELMDLVQRAIKEGILAGQMSFGQMVGSLEMAKYDVLNISQEIVQQQAAARKPLIVTPATLPGVPKIR